MDRNSGDSLAVTAGFSALSIGVAAALVPFRNTLGQANIALVVALVVVVAATLGGRVAGVGVGVVAAISFNFFHTQPYLTVRVNDAKDMVTVALILLVGLVVGEVGVARSRQSATRRSHLRSIRSLEDVGALVSAGASAEQVWPAVREGLVATLGVRSVRFDAGTHHPLPVIEHDGTLDVTHRRYLRDGFALPHAGAALNVATDGVFMGQIVLTPDDEVGVTREQRRAAAALADQFGIALRTEPLVRSFV
jgi:two-component system sensor histidine kinase KdpD